MENKRLKIVLVAFFLWGVFMKPVASYANEQKSDLRSITLAFENTDIDLVLKFYSDVTGIPIIKSDSIRGFLSVVAPDPVTVDEALSILQSVLDLKGFTLVRGPGNVMRVLSQAEAVQSNMDVRTRVRGSISGNGSQMVTQVIPLRFLSTQEAKAELSPLLSKSGSMIANDRMNILIVTDMEASISRLMKILDSVDVRSPQVLIEALVVEVSLTKETKLGLQWSQSGILNTHGHSFAENVAQDFGVGSFVSEGLKYSVVRSDQKLSGLLQALATDKNVNILSTPHIMTINNEPAVIRVGEEVPILTQTRNIQGGETIRSFDYKSVAIELEVTPRINQDRDVLLKVHPLVKKILGFNSELNAPILATREAQTTVLVKDGSTIVIGGLMKDDRSVNQSKIPLLGDIPILGALFRKKGTTKEKTEMLVFITPRVVLTAEEADAVTIRKEEESKSAYSPHQEDAVELNGKAEGLLKQGKKWEAIEVWEKSIVVSPSKKFREKTKRKIEKLKRTAKK